MRTRSLLNLGFFLGLVVLGIFFFWAAAYLAIHSPHVLYACSDFNQCEPIPASQYWYVVATYVGCGLALTAMGVYFSRHEWGLPSKNSDAA